MQMDFSLRPPSEIVLELKDRPEFASLTYLQECVRRMEGGASFPAAWRGAVEQERALGPMKREDTELLLSFGSGLGTTDLPGQKKLCEVHRKMTQQQIAAARQQYASKGRLATVLGTAAGAAAVILFI